MGNRMGKPTDETGSFTVQPRHQHLSPHHKRSPSDNYSHRSSVSAASAQLDRSALDLLPSLSTAPSASWNTRDSSPRSSTSITPPNFRWLDSLRHLQDSVRAATSPSSSSDPSLISSPPIADTPFLTSRLYASGKSEPCPSAAYAFPTGLPEADRLDQEHYMYRHIFGRNALTPLDRPAKVLDVGCGTAIWLLEMAADFPSSLFYGLDIADHHPGAILPANVSLVSADALAGLPYKAQSFDYLHIRMLATGIPQPAWEPFFTDLHRVTTLNGALEIVESDYVHHRTGPAGDQINAWIQEITLQRNVDLRIIHELEPLLEAAGFVDIECDVVSIPTGDWGGDIGRLALANYEAVLHGLVPQIIAFGVLEEEIDRIIAKWKIEVEDLQSFWNVRTYICHRRHS